MGAATISSVPSAVSEFALGGEIEMTMTDDEVKALLDGATPGPSQPETPTPGQFTTMCLAIEDVVTGRGFDVAIPEEVKAYMRNVLMVGGWRGERD